MEPIRFRCSNCSASIKVDGKAAGKSVRCPKCETKQTVPNQQTSLVPINKKVELPTPKRQAIAAVKKQSQVLKKLEQTTVMEFDERSILESMSTPSHPIAPHETPSIRMTPIQPPNVPDVQSPTFDDTRPCPFCHEPIKPAAKKCKHCGEFLDGSRSSNPPSATPTVVNHVNVIQTNNNDGGRAARWSPAVAALLSFIFPGLGQMYKGQLLNGVVWLIVVVIGYAAFIFPGAILHLCCIVGAASGDPYR